MYSYVWLYGFLLIMVMRTMNYDASYPYRIVQSP